MTDGPLTSHGLECRWKNRGATNRIHGPVDVPGSILCYHLVFAFLMALPEVLFDV